MTEKDVHNKGTDSLVRVTFQPMGISCSVPVGQTVMAAAASRGIELRSECGGKGTCGKCLVQITPTAHVSEISDNEIRALSRSAHHKGSRLACQAKIVQPISVTVPEAGLDSSEPVGKNLEGVTITGVKPNQNRAGAGEPSLGLALDIGTTTVALYLCSLGSGRILHSEAVPNPQRRYGEDVISRIAHANDHQDGLDDLHRTIVEAVNTLIDRSLERVGAERREVEKVTVVGNTTMQHLFAGQHPGRLGASPYMPESCKAQEHLAKDLGLALNPTCPVYIFPVVSGFVGGDTTGVMLCEKPYLRDEVTLVIDIGTNGEIVLGNRESIWVASCATGPALEGAHIECGMRASNGAIDKVSVDPASYQVEYETIGADATTTPKGLCGSGIIDAVAEMVLAGLILPSGRLREGLPGIVVDDSGIGREFVIAEDNDYSGRNRVVLTLADIRQVQLAKSALYTGIKLLMKRAGIETIDRLVLTGAFGARFNWRSAVAIGMLPESFLEAEVAVVENAAGRGAVMALLDGELRDEIQSAADNAHPLELAEDPDFTMEFTLHTSFPERQDEP